MPPPAAARPSTSSETCRFPTAPSSAPCSSIASKARPPIYLFRVEQVYKGDIENRIEVVAPAGSAACGLELGVGQRAGLLLTREGGEWRSSLCSQVDPSAFLALTDVHDNSAPPINWGGIVVGVLVLGAGGFFLLRKLRQYRGLR